MKMTLIHDRKYDFCAFWDYWSALVDYAKAEALVLDDEHQSLPPANYMMVAAYAAATWREVREYDQRIAWELLKVDGRSQTIDEMHKEMGVLKRKLRAAVKRAEKLKSKGKAGRQKAPERRGEVK